ncbi:glycosyltransferase family 87 protein [Mucilaginibacter sp. KACC 22063]|uniref:glycosyltransferase family 87 protein n=1 Tax=Mucilaginibacter sp. KACC 22063 TaxID=3025666 RepID=UPI0023663432|nr:glycosyltransferase family 87 protein [Mucilaginibacter sp. KACC 22063]WDF53382.1 glycosyltransferase family 87 protein [Mucilaginibacter sp. KACC 22063]
MSRTFPSLSNYKLSWVLLILVAVFCWQLKYFHNRYNNYKIFKYVYSHTTEEKNLYADYPEEYYDSNHYGPVFSVIVAPMALMPDAYGFLVWSLLNAVVLIWAVHLLPISTKNKALLLLLSAMEFANAEHYIQFNAVIAAFIIFSFILVEKRKEEWATLFIVLGTLVKLYPVVGLVFFLFAENKWKFIWSGLGWLAVFIALPMTISSPHFILQSYADWFNILQVKNGQNVNLTSSQDICLMGIFRHVTRNPNIPNTPFLIAGAAIFGAALLRFKQYASLQFRLQVLCSVMIMVVIFSTGSEHPTYIIAVPGVFLWMLTQDKPFSRWNIVLLVSVLVITSLGPTDAIPALIRRGYVNKYVLKAWPVVAAWLVISYQLLFKDFIAKEKQAALPAEDAKQEDELALA